MITYIEEMIGLTAGTLDSPFGAIVGAAIVLVMVQVLIKILCSWLDAFFGG